MKDLPPNTFLGGPELRAFAAHTARGIMIFVLLLGKITFFSINTFFHAVASKIR
jgi:hypothetical protein